MSQTPLIDRSTCTALVITCSDFRFKTAERAFAEQLGLVDDYDLIARPGASRAIVAPRMPAARETLLGEIDLLWSAHHFERILLVHHVSCRAYDDLATPDNERAVHSEHLGRAREALAGRQNDVRVETYLLEARDGTITPVVVGDGDAPGGDDPPLHMIRGKGMA